MKKKWLFSIISAVLSVGVVCGTLGTNTAFATVNDLKSSLVKLDENEIVNETGWKVAQYEYRSYLADLSTFPASFVYNGKQYKGFGSDFTLTSSTTKKEGAKESTTTVLTHQDGFTVRIESALYVSYGAYEWTLWFENGTNANTAVFEDVNACNINIAGTNPHVKGLTGDQMTQYYPYEYNLLKSDLYFTMSTGRATEEWMPYFNLETDSGGALIAVGWPGNWEAEFSYSKKQTNVLARQKDLRTYLKSGESFRSPLMAVVRYGERDEDLAMNTWRDWMIDCNMPKQDGAPVQPQITAGTNAYTNEMVTATEDIVIEAMQTFAENGIKFDYWWMDAGWYTDAANEAIGSWMQTGTWEVDQTRFPTKFKAVSDYAHSIGTKTILWFEPESIRVDINGLVENFGFKEEWATPVSMWGGSHLLDMANAECREWLLERVNTVLQDGGIGVYREDFNTRPTEAFVQYDETDRVGLYENQYLCGHLDYWDAILESNPGIVLDTCASGGNRNDLETLRRAVPMHVSDSAYGEYGAKQSMFYQLFKWIPFFGLPSATFTDLMTPNVYSMRNSYCASFNTFCYYNVDEQYYQAMYDCMKEHRTISKYLYADYYPITEYTRSESSWMGWEFFDDEKQEGYVELFRQENCTQDTYLMKLKGLADDATYQVTDFDGVNTFTKTGRELKEGVTVTLSQARSAYVATIKKV